MIRYVDDSNQETVEERFEKKYYRPEAVDTRGKSHWPGQAAVESEKLVDKWGREVFVLHPAYEKLIRGDYNPALEKRSVLSLVITMLSVVGSAALLQVVGLFITALGSSSRRYHDNGSIMPVFLIIGLVAIVLTLLFCLLVGYPYIRRFNRLLTHGELLQAQTFFVSNKYVKHYGKSGLYSLERLVVLDYEFTTPDGEVIRSQARATRNDLPEEIPERVLPVVVLYENKKNYIVL
ncbi:MAG TPA: hypothetical protein VH186_27350 [Chloroflexia bacterium]|nr:hypothetical protein [Chloroflexia bacterium]